MLTNKSQVHIGPETPAAYLAADDPPSKREILRTALRLFAQKGVEAVTVREIAAAAGYTNPALFKFFATKDALALHLFECCYLQLFDRLKAATAGLGTFADRLSAILAVFFRQLEQDPDAFLFVQDHLRAMWPHVSAATRRKSVLLLIRQTLEQGKQEGAVRGANSNLMVAAIAGTLQQFARMFHFGEFRGEVRDWLPEMEGILRRMIAP
jgi:TetR/AcrR family transcriptional regulator, repressor of fatR-cypB operon